jgi:hypothetical protein
MDKLERFSVAHVREALERRKKCRFERSPI